MVDWEFAGTYPLSDILGPMDMIYLSEEFYKSDPEIAHAEEEKWNAQVIKDVESVARKRGWHDRDVKTLLGESHQIFLKAGFEMFPRDWMDDSEEEDTRNG